MPGLQLARCARGIDRSGCAAVANPCCFRTFSRSKTIGLLQVDPPAGERSRRRPLRQERRRSRAKLPTD